MFSSLSAYFSPKPAQMDDSSPPNPAAKRTKKPSAKAAETAATTRPSPMMQPDGTEVLPLETPQQPVETAKEGPKQLPWTPEMQAMLVDEVWRSKAYEHGEMGAKFEAIAEALFKSSTFKGYKKVKGPTIQKKFLRLKDSCKRDWAMDGEGANLSGLSSMDTEDFPQFKKTIYNIILKEMKSSHQKEAVTLKEKFRNESMLTHEKVSIAVYLIPLPLFFSSLPFARRCCCTIAVVWRCWKSTRRGRIRSATGTMR